MSNIIDYLLLLYCLPHTESLSKLILLSLSSHKYLSFLLPPHSLLASPKLHTTPISIYLFSFTFFLKLTFSPHFPNKLIIHYFLTSISLIHTLHISNCHGMNRLIIITIQTFWPNWSRLHSCAGQPTHLIH